MATCDEVRPMLGAMADKELSPLEADAVAIHLEQCGRCRQIVREQQRVQHVLNSFQPPPVPETQWDLIGKRLRAELQGKGEPLKLKTRPRVEALDPTPASAPSLRADEMAAPFQRVPEPPRQAPRTPSTTARPAAVTVLKVRPERHRGRLAWVAHVVGAVAATIIIVVGMVPSWTPSRPAPTPSAPAATAGAVASAAPIAPTAPIALAGPGDVSIMAVEMTVPGYNLIVAVGDADDVAAVLVVRSEGNG
ncbi:MAG: zf-HC2 domain-containing protein [Planctomycetota bacterium]|nr:zf-HC2 domain-containing protein [Planctomycetota bacterium]